MVNCLLYGFYLNLKKKIKKTQLGKKLSMVCLFLYNVNERIGLHAPNHTLQFQIQHMTSLQSTIELIRLE